VTLTLCLNLNRQQIHQRLIAVVTLIADGLVDRCGLGPSAATPERYRTVAGMNVLRTRAAGIRCPTLS
jgi:hypothetical protein